MAVKWAEVWFAQYNRWGRLTLPFNGPLTITPK